MQIGAENIAPVRPIVPPEHFLSKTCRRRNPGGGCRPADKGHQESPADRISYLVIRSRRTSSGEVDTGGSAHRPTLRSPSQKRQDWYKEAGLVRAWQPLVSGDSLTAPAVEENDEHLDIIIPLSDSANNWNCWCVNGSSVSSGIDSRMIRTAVEPAPKSKTAGSKTSRWSLILSRSDTGGDLKSALFENCASSQNDEPAGRKF